jgi:3-deoxy-D-manno-octulosonic-acid transferase
MSDKSFKRWSKYKFAVSSILDKFKVILCQSEKDHKKYVELGASNSVYSGNLKYSASKLDIDSHKLRVMKNQTKSRIIFLAASTHPGEEEIVLNTHVKLSEKYPKLLTIIAPRHVNRANEIIKLAKNRNLKCSLRSKNQIINADTNVYLADTLGELGLFFTIAKATFMGGSFNIGGHNLIEPAYFPTIIIFGPDMSGCQEVADEFLEKKAAFQIKDEKELINVLDQIYEAKICANAEKNALIIQKHNNIISNYMSYIKQHIEQ